MSTVGIFTLLKQFRYGMSWSNKDNLSDMTFTLSDFESKKTIDERDTEFYLWGSVGVFVLFMVLASTWPTEYGAHADDVPVMPGQGRGSMIQPRDGGRVAQLMVKDGQHVVEGQVIAKLVSEQAQSDLAERRGKRAALTARVARLQAAVTSSDMSDRPADVPTAVWTTEQAILSAWRSGLNNEIAAAQARLPGLRQSVAASDSQVAMYGELMAKGLGPRRSLNEQILQNGSLHSQLATAEAEINRLRAARLESASKELSAESEALASISTEGVEDRINEGEIRSPIAGTVKSLSNQAVIKAGDTLAEVVPDGQALYAEARFDVLDAPFVRQGHAVVGCVKDSSGCARRIKGTIESVSPDALIDEKDPRRASYFSARIKLDEESVKEVRPGYRLYVSTQMGTRTIMQYLVGYGIEGSLKSFREIR